MHPRFGSQPNFTLSYSPTFQSVSCAKDKTEDPCQVPRVCWYVDLHKERQTDRETEKKRRKTKEKNTTRSDETE
jgi:hypothetical protein